MSSSSRKVLVAESDEIVLALISHILHRQGYLVDVALTADDAMQCLRLKQYNAVVVDSKLFAVMEHFPQSLAQTIVLGSFERPGVHAVLPKPVEFGALVDAVADCVK